MRIPVLLTGLLTVVLAAAPLQRAPAQDDKAGGGEASFDLFYNNLADDGDWYNTPEYGYVWQPFIAYKTDSWRPYSDGYWAQTDSGWTWVSYENFGWATYHYGRWTRLKDIGWAWVPGYQWGPGWVSWRTNDDYVGWAPLPPKVERGVYEGKIVERRSAEREVSVDYNDVEPEDEGYTSNVDQDYDIGPANYCFVHTRSFGAPVLSEELLPSDQNVTIIERTNNVTNIYYNREQGNEFVYNGGPRYEFISAHSERPIQRLQIERVRNPSYLEEGLRAGGNPTQVRGGILQVAAPLIARRPVNFQQMKPVRVKQTIERPEVMHGWANTGANPEQVQQLHNRFKEQAQQAPARAEAPKERVVQPLPPEQRVVTRQPAPLPAVKAGENGQPKDLSPEAVAARRTQRQQERAAQAGQPATQPGQPVPAAGQPKPGAPAQPLTDADRVARRNAAQQAREARNKQPNGQPVPAQAGQPGQPGQAGPNNGQPKDTSPEAVAARRAQRQQERAGQTGAKTPEQAAQPAAKAPEQAAQPKDNSEEAKAARRAQRQQERAAQPGAKVPEPAVQPAAKAPEQAAQPKDNSEEAKAARRTQRQQERAPQPQAQPQQQAAPQADAEREARRAQRQQEKAQQAQPQAQPQQQAAPQADAEREARRAQRQQEKAQQAQPQAQPQQQAAPQADAEREARRAQRQQEKAQQAQPQPAQANQEREARQAQREQAQPAPQANAQREAQHAEKQGDKGDKDKKDKPNQ